MNTHSEFIINRLRQDGIEMPPAVGDRLDHVHKLEAARLEATGHFDSNESAFLARQLLYVKTREANILYPNVMFRNFIPVSNEVPSGAETYSIKTWDIDGFAKIIANYAQDFPLVNTFLTETTAKIRSVGIGYSYSIQDLRAAAMSPNVSIDTRRADVARQMHDRTVELIAAYGDAAAGLPGFVNNSNLAAASGLTGTWSSATGEVILADLHKIAQSVVTQSKTIHKPDTMLLPTAAYGLVATKSYSSLVPDTILAVFLRSSPYSKNVDQWVLLDAANSQGNLAYNRIICYGRDPVNLTFEIPQEFEQLPPQLEGMVYKIPCHSRVGGVSLTYPLSAVYADNMI